MSSQDPTHRQATGSGGTSAETTAETMRDEAAGLARDAKSAVGEAGRAAADFARDRTDAARETVADEIFGVSQALRRASDDLRGGSAQERSFAAAADALADMADTVRGKDLGEIAGGLSDFARRNPSTFLAGAALLGFAGARLAKASHRPAQPHDPWQDAGQSGLAGDDAGPGETAATRRDMTRGAQTHIEGDLP